MLCLSFGWLIILTLVLALVVAILPGGGFLGRIGMAALIIWFIAGFIATCTGHVGKTAPIDAPQQ